MSKNNNNNKKKKALQMKCLPFKTLRLKYLL